MIAMNKEVLEGNKLIAVFMGWSQQLDVEERWYGAWFDQHGVRKAWPKGHEPLLFHVSWDWLMPVVKKINLLDEYEYSVTIYTMDCHIQDKKGNTVISIDCKNTVDELIKSVYGAVVEFIKWYNENNKTLRGINDNKVGTISENSKSNILYYTVEKRLIDIDGIEEADGWKDIIVYTIEDNIPKIMCEFEALNESFAEEEIQTWLDNEEMGGEFEFVKL